MSLNAIAFTVLSLIVYNLFTPCLANVRGDNTLVLGMVTNNPAKQIKRLKPIADYVVAQLENQNITRSKIILARDNLELIELIKSGQIDWITESVYSALLFEQQADARIFLNRWKKNSSSYHSIFITRKDSGIKSIRDLAGKTLALEDSGSTTGFFLPLIELMQHELETVYLPALNAPLNDRVGYVFSKDELNTANWVFQGMVQAGAYSNTDWESDKQTPANLKKELIIIAQTDEFPRMLELLAPHIDQELEHDITRILLNAVSDPAGLKALKKYQHTTRFEQLDDAALAALDKARSMLPELNKQHIQLQE